MQAFLAGICASIPAECLFFSLLQDEAGFKRFPSSLFLQETFTIVRTVVTLEAALWGAKMRGQPQGQRITTNVQYL